jgi:hypothetical protein
MAAAFDDAALTGSCLGRNTGLVNGFVLRQRQIPFRNARQKSQGEMVRASHEFGSLPTDDPKEAHVSEARHGAPAFVLKLRLGTADSLWEWQQERSGI